MKVHHFAAGTLCPRVGRLITGTGGLFDEARMICHCLLVESDAGLILVDTGLGTADLADPRARLGKGFAAMMRPRRERSETAIGGVERLGFSARDVRHVLVTHLDLDHAGGLPDFPDAAVHVFEAEHDAAMARATLVEKERYRPAHWAHGPKWVRYRVQGEPWLGFECVRQLEGLPPEVLLVPLTGHTRGHVAVAVRQSSGGADWALHAGDAYFHHDEVHAPARRCPVGLDLFQRTMAYDRALWSRNQARLRALVRAHGRAHAAAGAETVDVFSAHDPVELDRLAAA
jgi:glyoxylase-like metal-dependent hydrolase (beta-lactamase superfamily II)